MHAEAIALWHAIEAAFESEIVAAYANFILDVKCQITLT